MPFANFTPMPQETCIDVPRSAIVRLLQMGRDRSKDATADKGRFAEQLYWDGYCRALEHVIEMEDE